LENMAAPSGRSSIKGIGPSCLRRGLFSFNSLLFIKYTLIFFYQNSEWIYNTVIINFGGR